MGVSQEKIPLHLHELLHGAEYAKSRARRLSGTVRKGREIYLTKQTLRI